jgi:hypothetical protein
MSSAYESTTSDPQWWAKPAFIYILYSLFALAAGVQALLGAPKMYHDGGIAYARYNNYVIFKQSYSHLVGQQDLYIHYPSEHWDLYKYTPSFAVFFGVFAHLPDWVGVCLWSLVNALALVVAVHYLPHLSLQQKAIILLSCLIEMMTSLQNGQSNGLLAGMFIMAFAALERHKTILASGLLVGSVFIKLFGLVACLFYVFQRKKIPLAAWNIAWAAALFLCPLLFISIEQYDFLWHSYARMLAEDHDASYGFSVMGIVHTWTGLFVSKMGIVLIGAVLLLAPFLRFSRYKNLRFRMLALASVLIWVVIFNHKAESPTFIIAMAGAALWYAGSARTRLDTALFVFAFVLTSLSPTDLFPRYLRQEWVQPYALKALPCVLIWGKILVEMWRNDFTSSHTPQSA